MYFASKKVYVQKQEETEMVDDDIMDEDIMDNIDHEERMQNDFNDIDLELNTLDDQLAQPQSNIFGSFFGGSTRSFSSTPHVRGQRKRREDVLKRKRAVKSANTNVVSVELKCIGKQGELMTGDPTHCENCGASFSSLSTISENESDQIWNCEYCDTENVVFIEEQEIPKTPTVDYIVKPADKLDESPEETIIFVVDISGSMCVTTEIQGSHKFKASKSDSEVFGNLNMNNQYFPGQPRGVSYVSRLQCVQTAIESQILALAATQPNAKIGLVCFSNEVTIYGDGQQSPVSVAGDRLNDRNKLIEIGNSFQIESTIGVAKDAFLEKMYELNEGGATALGPAALVAIGMAQQATNSKIVIATDGLANIGIGSMEGMVTDDEISQLSTFYTEVAQYAQTQGITINVISIAGEQVNMEQLGKLADQTQGDVNIVDPTKLTDEFSDILSSKTIATNVEATFYLHKGLGFSDISTEDVHNLANNCVTRIVGNAYEETELTFEFVVKNDNVENLLQNRTSLPFQVMIKYTLPNGMEGLRVITQSKDLTDNRAEAEEEIDLGIMGMHNNWRSAKFAEEGRYEDVFENNLSVQNLMRRNITDELDQFTYTNYTSDSKQLNTQSRQEQMSMTTPQTRHDETSNTIFQFKNRKRNAKAYKKKK